jgi:hypothetical protein
VSPGRIRPLAVLLNPRNVGIAVNASVGRRRRRTLGPIPEFQGAQDIFDHGALIDQADDFQRAGAARANEWIRFVHFLDKPRPRVPQLARQLIGATGVFLVRRQRIGRLCR